MVAWRDDIRVLCWLLGVGCVCLLCICVPTCLVLCVLCCVFTDDGACLRACPQVEFARDEELVVLADEVYQTNLWDDSLPFVSFKKVAHDMGALDDGLQLVSFHSVSKGFLGEFVTTAAAPSTHQHLWC